MERGGAVHSFHVKQVTSDTLRPIMDKYIAKTSRLMTDTSRTWRKASSASASYIKQLVEGKHKAVRKPYGES
jgi:hypothetical protein